MIGFWAREEAKASIGRGIYGKAASHGSDAAQNSRGKLTNSDICSSSSQISRRPSFGGLCPFRRGFRPRLPAFFPGNFTKKYSPNLNQTISKTGALSCTWPFEFRNDWCAPNSNWGQFRSAAAPVRHLASRGMQLGEETSSRVTSGGDRQLGSRAIQRHLHWAQGVGERAPSVQVESWDSGSPPTFGLKFALRPPTRWRRAWCRPTRARTLSPTPLRAWCARAWRTHARVVERGCWATMVEEEFPDLEIAEAPFWHFLDVNIGK